MWEGEVGAGSDVAQLCLDPRLDRSYLKLCFLGNCDCILYTIKGLFIHMYSVVTLPGNGESLL